jgi:hypothetical protein
MKDTSITLQERANLVLLSHIKGCTLDGFPAIVCGQCNNFAMVSRWDGIGGGVSFSWEAVKRIMEENREFKS